MLFISYKQDDDGVRTHVEGKCVDTIDMIIALFHIAKACEMTKAQAAGLIEVWDIIDETLKED